MPKRLGRRPLPPSSLPPPGPRPAPPVEPLPPRTPAYVYVVRRSSMAEIITVAVLIAVLLLLGVGLMLWAVRSDLAFGPTPTPTRTSAPPLSATPDFRATRLAEDMLTQTAYQAALLGTRTPTPPQLVTPGAPGHLLPPDLTATATLTPTPVTVMLPGIAVYGPTPESSETPLSALATPTPIVVVLPIGISISALPTPAPDEEVFAPPTETPGELPTAIPTETPAVLLPPAAPPTFTPEPPTPAPLPPTPSPTPLPPPTATGQPYLVTSLRAFVRNENTTVRLGPSVVYTATGTLAANSEVQLLGRTPSGEWVYACCVDNRPGWVRQAYARPRDNGLPPGAPQGTNGNDVRWLGVQPVTTGLLPLPTPTPIPPGDYPLWRYTRDAQGRLPQLPQPSVSLAWPAPAQASQALISPAVVTGASVVVASADQHLYSFDRINGNQRWRNNLGQPIRQAPAVLGGEIFVADDAGRLIALADRGNESVQIWNTGTGLPAVTSFSVYSDTLFVGVGQDGSYQLLAVDRDNGAVLRTFTLTGSPLRYPAVGDQLVYAAAGVVVALDVLNYEVVWRRDDLTNISAGPVYSSPGVRGLAELYLVDGNNRLFCLDANTGIELWNYDNGEAASGLAVNDRFVFVSGNGYVKAITRDTVQQAWRATTAGLVVGGAWVDNERVLALTQGGTLHFMDAASGGALGGAIVP
ncbi:MAG: hypothetical protein DCC57_11690, partial [Chloroflexi bacterium]